MAERKPFLLRVDSKTLHALQRWAADDLRSLNGQIEFVLRDASGGDVPGGSAHIKIPANGSRTVRFSELFPSRNEVLGTLSVTVEDDRIVALVLLQARDQIMASPTAPLR